MSIFSAMKSFNALPLMADSPHTKAAARHSLKRHNNRTEYQVCGHSICRASAAVSEERITNGEARPMTLQAPQQPCEAGRLTDDGTAFLEEHRIRGYEVGPDQKTTIVTIANLLQVCCPEYSDVLSLCPFGCQRVLYRNNLPSQSSSPRKPSDQNNSVSVR